LGRKRQFVEVGLVPLFFAVTPLPKCCDEGVLDKGLLDPKIRLLLTGLNYGSDDTSPSRERIFIVLKPKRDKKFYD